MKKKPYLYFLALTALCSCGNNEPEFDATGTFEATEVTVSAQITGKIEAFNIVEGQQVTANAVLGAIDATQLRLKKQQLATQQSQLNAAKRQTSATQEQLNANRMAIDSRVLNLETQIASIQQQIDNQKKEKQRFSELLKDGAATRKQVEEIGYQISVLQKQLAATREQLASTNASLAEQSKGLGAQIEGLGAQNEGVDAQSQNINVQQSQLDEQISNTQIISPITGTILEKYMERGEFAITGKPLFKVADTKHMIMRAYITSEQLQKVRVGQRVKVFANYGNGERKEYPGTITWISSRSEFTPKTILTDDERADLVYAVKIAVNNDGYIKIGMYGEVKLLTSSAQSK